METFKVKGLILRSFTEDDVADVYEYASDKETVKYLTFEAHTSTQQTLKVIQDFYMKPNIYAIEIQETGKCIGCFDLRIDMKNNKASFGYVLNKGYWNKGYMSEVLRFFIRYCFENLKLNRVESTYYVGNEGSGKVMMKCGMKQEGIGCQEVYIKNRYVDVVHMAILVEEYKEKLNKRGQ